MRIHVVHGILSPVGTSGLLGLVPFLQAAGFECRVPDYGLITASETRIVNPLIWRSIRPYIEPGDLFIGHSNGCAIGYELAQDGAPFAGAVFINAALRRDAAPSAPIWLDTYYNAGDLATVAAVASAAAGFSDCVWGDMGHAGPTEYDPTGRIVGVNCGPDVWTNEYALPPVSGHSDIFTPMKLAAWGPYIVKRIQQRLSIAPLSIRP